MRVCIGMYIDMKAPVLTPLLSPHFFTILTDECMYLQIVRERHTGPRRRSSGPGDCSGQSLGNWGNL